MSDRLGRCVVLGLSLAVALDGCASVTEPRLESGWPASEAARPLGHQDCVRLALESTTTAAQWQARRMAAEAALRQASAGVNPTFIINWESFGLDSNASNAALEKTFSLTLSLADLLARRSKVDAAQADLDAEEAALRAEQRKMTAEVWHAYDELLAARRRIELRSEVVEVATREALAVQKLADAGLSAPIDAARADAERLQAESELARARDDERVLALAFAFALGFERPVAIALADSLPVAPPRTALDEIDARIPQAVAARPEVAAARARYEGALARARLAASWSRFLPTVGGGYRRADEQNLGVASLEVPVPVFDTGAAGIDAEQAALLTAAAELNATVRRVALEVEQAEQRLHAATGLLEEHVRPLAERRHQLREASTRLFEAGEVAYDQVLLAARDEIAARLEVLDAEMRAAGAHVDLALSLGDPLE